MPSAQRRPGRQPRRHSSGAASRHAAAEFAQRRPGRQPRRHGQVAPDRTHGRVERSTKAGASTPATLQRMRIAGPRVIKPLNEGRGVNPGDTASVVPRLHPGHQRSTKAGASTPATRLTDGRAESAGGAIAQRRPGRQPRRHWNSGNSAPVAAATAQRRPGRQPRRHEARNAPQKTSPPRSTKAGASTPATLAPFHTGCDCYSDAQRRPGRQPRRHQADSRREYARVRSLNEGRGVNPGDTRGKSYGGCLTPWAAQRRPGRQPRRHAEQ